ncbi:hypothetical protein E143388_07192 [Rhodococcus opacus]|nr:hypothetical protein E143388_07192 [Rhodococcus opacus]
MWPGNPLARLTRPSTGRPNLLASVGVGPRAPAGTISPCPERDVARTGRPRAGRRARLHRTDMRMSFEVLALISAAALAGPVLASRRTWHLPVVLGELLAGILLGFTGLRILDPGDPTFTFLADIGFALVMFVAGTHVPIRDARIRPALAKGVVRAVLVGVGATLAGFGIAQAFGTGHAALYAVLIASSSAALVLPLIDSLGLEGTPIVQTVAQVAVADIACIVALPLVIDPAQAPRAAAGAVAVTGATAVFYAVLRASDKRGWLHSLHHESKERGFALELRINLGVLCLLAALAVHSHVSIMLAGFALGLVIAAVGEPRRLAKQLFSITEGFFGPVLRLARRILECPGPRGGPLLDTARRCARPRCRSRPLPDTAGRCAAAPRRIGRRSTRRARGRGGDRYAIASPGPRRAFGTDPRRAGHHRFHHIRRRDGGTSGVRRALTGVRGTPTRVTSPPGRWGVAPCRFPVSRDHGWTRPPSRPRSTAQRGRLRTRPSCRTPASACCRSIR